MKVSEKIEELLEREAKDLSSKRQFSYEDAISALKRSYNYYMDIGKDEQTSLEEAQTLVAEAVYLVPELGFEDLRGVIDYMIFSIYHRVPSRI